MYKFPSPLLQRRSEETAEIYAEKSRLKEEEAILTEHKAHTFKQEMDRLRESHIKTEKEKADLELKIRDAEFNVVHLTEEKEKRAAESDKLKNELLFARDRERDATKKLLNFLSRSVVQCSMESVLSGTQGALVDRSSAAASSAASQLTLALSAGGGGGGSTSGCESPAYGMMNGGTEAEQLQQQNDDDCDLIVASGDMEQITNEIEKNR